MSEHPSYYHQSYKAPPHPHHSGLKQMSGLSRASSGRHPPSLREAKQRYKWQAGVFGSRVDLRDSDFWNETLSKLGRARLSSSTKSSLDFNNDLHAIMNKMHHWFIHRGAVLLLAKGSRQFNHLSGNHHGSSSLSSSSSSCSATGSAEQDSEMAPSMSEQIDCDSNLFSDVSFDNNADSLGSKSKRGRYYQRRGMHPSPMMPDRWDASDSPAGSSTVTITAVTKEEEERALAMSKKFSEECLPILMRFINDQLMDELRLLLFFKVLSKACVISNIDWTAKDMIDLVGLFNNIIHRCLLFHSCSSKTKGILTSKDDDIKKGEITTITNHSKKNHNHGYHPKKNHNSLKKHTDDDNNDDDNSGGGDDSETKTMTMKMTMTMKTEMIAHRRIDGGDGSQKCSALKDSDFTLCKTLPSSLRALSHLLFERSPSIMSSERGRIVLEDLLVNRLLPLLTMYREYHSCVSTKKKLRSKENGQYVLLLPHLYELLSKQMGSQPIRGPWTTSLSTVMPPTMTSPVTRPVTSTDSAQGSSDDSHGSLSSISTIPLSGDDCCLVSPTATTTTKRKPSVSKSGTESSSDGTIDPEKWADLDAILTRINAMKTGVGSPGPNGDAANEDVPIPEEIVQRLRVLKSLRNLSASCIGHCMAKNGGCMEPLLSKHLSLFEGVLQCLIDLKNEWSDYEYETSVPISKIPKFTLRSSIQVREKRRMQRRRFVAQARPGSGGEGAPRFDHSNTHHLGKSGPLSAACSTTSSSVGVDSFSDAASEMDGGSSTTAGSVYDSPPMVQTVTLRRSFWFENMQAFAKVLLPRIRAVNELIASVSKFQCIRTWLRNDQSMLIYDTISVLDSLMTFGICSTRSAVEKSLELSAGSSLRRGGFRLRLRHHNDEQQQRQLKDLSGSAAAVDDFSVFNSALLPSSVDIDAYNGEVLTKTVRYLENAKRSTGVHRYHYAKRDSRSARYGSGMNGDPMGPGTRSKRDARSLVATAAAVGAPPVSGEDLKKYELSLMDIYTKIRLQSLQCLKIILQNIPHSFDHYWLKIVPNNEREAISYRPFTGLNLLTVIIYDCHFRVRNNGCLLLQLIIAKCPMIKMSNAFSGVSKKMQSQQAFTTLSGRALQSVEAIHAGLIYVLRCFEQEFFGARDLSGVPRAVPTVPGITSVSDFDQSIRPTPLTHFSCVLHTLRTLLCLVPVCDYTKIREGFLADMTHFSLQFIRNAESSPALRQACVDLLTAIFAKSLYSMELDQFFNIPAPPPLPMAPDGSGPHLTQELVQMVEQQISSTIVPQMLHFYDQCRPVIAEMAKSWRKPLKFWWDRGLQKMIDEGLNTPFLIPITIHNHSNNNNMSEDPRTTMFEVVLPGLDVVMQSLEIVHNWLVYTKVTPSVSEEDAVFGIFRNVMAAELFEKLPWFLGLEVVKKDVRHLIALKMRCLSIIGGLRKWHWDFLAMQCQQRIIESVLDCAKDPCAILDDGSLWTKPSTKGARLKKASPLQDEMNLRSLALRTLGILSVFYNTPVPLSTHPSAEREDSAPPMTVEEFISKCLSLMFASLKSHVAHATIAVARTTETDCSPHWIEVLAMPSRKVVLKYVTRVTWALARIFDSKPSALVTQTPATDDRLPHSKVDLCMIKRVTAPLFPHWRIHGSESSSVHSGGSTLGSTAYLDYSEWEIPVRPNVCGELVKKDDCSVVVNCVHFLKSILCRRLEDGSIVTNEPVIDPLMHADLICNCLKCLGHAGCWIDAPQLTELFIDICRCLTAFLRKATSSTGEKREKVVSAACFAAGHLVSNLSVLELASVAAMKALSGVFGALFAILDLCENWKLRTAAVDALRKSPTRKHYSFLFAPLFEACFAVLANMAAMDRVSFEQNKHKAKLTERVTLWSADLLRLLADDSEFLRRSLAVRQSLQKHWRCVLAHLSEVKAEFDKLPRSDESISSIQKRQTDLIQITDAVANLLGLLKLCVDVERTADPSRAQVYVSALRECEAVLTGWL